MQHSWERVTLHMVKKTSSLSSIYKVTHGDTIVYIGRTKSSVESRRKSHYYKCFKRHTRSPNRPLYVFWRSLQSSSELNFSLVEKCDPKKQRIREQFWIDHFSPILNGRNEIKSNKGLNKWYDFYMYKFKVFWSPRAALKQGVGWPPSVYYNLRASCRLLAAFQRRSTAADPVGSPLCPVFLPWRFQ